MTMPGVCHHTCAECGAVSEQRHLVSNTIFGARTHLALSDPAVWQRPLPGSDSRVRAIAIRAGERLQKKATRRA